MPEPGDLLSDAPLRFRGTGQDREAALARWPASSTLAVTASVALALGLLVYMADRPAGQSLPRPTAFSLTTGPLFGALGQWLPSFVHPFAFSLYSAALCARAKRPAYGACVAWWSVNMMFEVGQHPSVAPWVVDRLVRVPNGHWLTDPASNYLLRGTFDVGDLLAVALGALAAACVMRLLQPLSEARHAQKAIHL